MKEFEKKLKALANFRRLEILKFLRGKKEANVTEIAEKIKLSFKSTSRHLRILLNADIVLKEQRALEVYYYLSSDVPPILKELISKL